jgi:hypothetical protein
MNEKPIEDKTKLVCEHCGLEISRKPWPKGWVQCGTSKRFLSPRGYVALAAWCPRHGQVLYHRVEQ